MTTNGPGTPGHAGHDLPTQGQLDADTHPGGGPTNPFTSSDPAARRNGGSRVLGTLCHPTSRSGSDDEEGVAVCDHVDPGAEGGALEELHHLLHDDEPRPRETLRQRLGRLGLLSDNPDLR